LHGMRLNFLSISCLSIVLTTAACSDFHRGTQIRHPGAAGPRPDKGTAAWVVDQYFAEPWFKDKKKHVTGEFRRRFASAPTLGEALPLSATIVMRPLVLTDKQAIFATTITNRGRIAEWYSYLVSEQDQWKLSAVRTLQLPPLYHALLDSLRRGWRVPDAVPTLQQSMELTIAPDSTLKAYVIAHQPQLDSLVHVFSARAQMTLVDVANASSPELRDGAVVGANRNAKLQTMLQRVPAATVFRDDRYPDCVFVRVGGMGRKQTGFLYAPEGCRIPPIHPDNFIYVERASNEWYVYKAL
jgi:hypothetical protein